MSNFPNTMLREFSEGRGLRHYKGVGKRERTCSWDWFGSIYALQDSEVGYSLTGETAFLASMTLYWVV